jgi:molybdate transport system permease protein
MTLSDSDIAAVRITLQLALLSTAILLFLSAPLAFWLSRSRSHLKIIIETLVALPLVLPPTVLGFYLLLALGASSPFSSLLSFVSLPPLAFTFSGLVVGSLLYSLPFVVQPLQNAFSAQDILQSEAAATLGAGPIDRFFSIALPQALPGILTASITGFAHTIGEFGVVLMIGGNIPGETRVLSIAIYDAVESMDYSRAHLISSILLLFSFTLLLSARLLERSRKAGA